MRRALVGLSLGLVALVSGCGEDAPPDAAALADTVAAKAASKQSTHVRFELGGITTGEGSYRIAPDLAADVSMSAPDGQSRYIVLDKAIYLRQQGGEKPWVRFAAGSGSVVESMAVQANISVQLARMKAAGTITDTAKEDIDGRATTRYSIDLDVDRLTAYEPAEGLKASLRELRKQGITRIPYRLWLDEEKLPVKVVIEIAGQSSIVRYGKWGEPIAITAPPADQVVDAPKR